MHCILFVHLGMILFSARAPGQGSMGFGVFWPYARAIPRPPNTRTFHSKALFQCASLLFSANILHAGPGTHVGAIQGCTSYCRRSNCYPSTSQGGKGRSNE